MRIVLEELLAGVVAPLGKTTSAIAKTPRVGRVRVGREGLESDAQADRVHHGGEHKALHHYPFDHYAAWRNDLGPHPRLEARGGFGENLSTTGLTERDVCVGDVFSIGDVRLEISQGRQPCFKLGLHFERKDMPRLVQQSGRTGWYYRVLEEGEIEAGQELVLVDRPNPAWPLTRIVALLYEKSLDRGELESFAALPGLAPEWVRLARRRLDSGRVEDWKNRLEGKEN